MDKKKVDAELEQRILEEQRKMAEKSSKSRVTSSEKKEATLKKKTKEKEITDKLDVKKPKQDSLQKQIDYHKFLELQQAKLDYAEAFSYLGKLRTAENKYEESEDANIKIIYQKNETISWERIKHYVEEKKMDSMMNVNRNFEMNDERDAYKWWAALNVWQSYRLFETSLT